MAWALRSYNFTSDWSIGRFTQTDPILGNRPGKHYAYAGNNPVSRMDPWGLDDDPWFLQKGLAIRRAWDRLVDEPWSTNPAIEAIRGGLRGVRNIGDSIGRGAKGTVDTSLHLGQTYDNAVESTGQTITAVREEGLGNVLQTSGQSVARMAEEDPEHFSAEVAGMMALAVAPSPIKGLSPLFAETRVAQVLTTPIKSLEFLDTTVGDIASNSWKYAKQTGSLLSKYEVAVEGLGANGGNVRIRPKFRKATIEQAFAEAPGTWGGKACPTCGTRVGAGTVERGGVIRRDFDIDHTGKTWADRVKAMPDDISREAVIDAYQEGVRVQCPGCNQGHMYEPSR